MIFIFGGEKVLITLETKRFLISKKDLGGFMDENFMWGVKDNFFLDFLL